LKSTRDIRLYPNRRLYDPVVAGYIKYSDVLALVRDGNTVKIEDTVSGKDRTAKVLVDLVVIEEQAAGSERHPVLTEAFLKDLIRLSSGEQAALVLAFLDHTVNMLNPSKPGTEVPGKPR
jgi:polyhydroxyalkanoate synthesis repressor PhaR